MKKILNFLLIIIFSGSIYSVGYDKTIRITSYYPNDQTGSGKCTASGYCTKDFSVNKDGIYTFQNKIVIATATYHCTKSKKGICKKYNQLPSGYHQYNLYDEITINFNNKNYEAIVLDICGACYWKEEYQRYDLFVTDKSKVIDTIGYTHIKEMIHIPFLLITISLVILLLIQFFMEPFKNKLKINKFKNIIPNIKSVKKEDF